MSAMIVQKVLNLPLSHRGFKNFEMVVTEFIFGDDKIVLIKRV